MFVHVYPAAASGEPQIVTQWDGELLTNGNRPTVRWNDIEEVYFGEPFALTIPAETAPGDYILAVGLYDYVSKQRLAGVDGQTFYTIPFSVTASNDAG
jgi:hypothetical protein